MPIGNVPFPSVADTVEKTFLAASRRLIGQANGKVALALSGGGDSTALLHLAVTVSPDIRSKCIAYTVDHGLRPEARSEAEAVSALCERFGVPHKILCWTPGANKVSQADARRARHALLADAARADGAHLILTGHTCDDDAETFLIRARAGSGWYGLAGIQPLSLSPVWPEGREVLIGRPLLSISREALRDHLKRSALTWIDDPSNDNPRFERIRMRHLLAEAPHLAGRIFAIQKNLKQLRAAEDRLLALWFETNVAPMDDGTLRLDDDLPMGETGVRALSWLCQLASGRDRPPRGDELHRLVVRFREPDFAGATLGGARFWKRSHSWWAGRDPGDVPNPTTVLENPIWDGRFEVAQPFIELSAIKELQPNARAAVPQKDGMRLAASCLIHERLQLVQRVLKIGSIPHLTSNS